MIQPYLQCLLHPEVRDLPNWSHVVRRLKKYTVREFSDCGRCLLVLIRDNHYLIRDGAHNIYHYMSLDADELAEYLPQNKAIDYPVKVKATPKFIEELNNCEFGRFEDAQLARENKDAELIEANNYETVLCDFGARFKTMLVARNDAELCEIYYACASGTIGVNGFTIGANKVLDAIREQVRLIDPTIVKRFPNQNGW